MSNPVPDARIAFDRRENVTVASFDVAELADHQYVAAMLEKFKQEIRDHQPPNVVVDLAGVDYISTIGINMILVILKRVRTYGGEVYIAGLAGSASKVFKIMQLDQVFTIFPDRQSALKKIAAQN